ncbi:MAG: nucleotidyltransferase domain-containing protein [Acidobacteria bacterium]|nr:nucleotidyltransferase domain-containing protein [Acidobacteriota bacterium]
MNFSPENEHFGRLILALEPWLNQVVIIGGWAHRLYRLDPRAQPLSYAPILTLDTDVAIPAQLDVTKHDIRERLAAQGFKEERLGHDQPPATHYRLGEQETGFYAEFLTPLTGSEYTRAGRPKATTRIGGIVSQRLRYIELLLSAPWTVNLDASTGFPLRQATKVRIANPAAFLAHKLLIHSKRNPVKFAKDILYIHDTLETFGGHLEELQAEWFDRVRPQLHQRSARVVERGADALFGDVTDMMRRAARIASGRALSPELMQEVCLLGLKRIFGDRCAPG